VAASNPSKADEPTGTANSKKSERLTARLVYWAVTSSLAGFLFGFDTVVISGAEQAIEKLWHLYTVVAPAHLATIVANGHSVIRSIAEKDVATPLDGIADASALYGTIVGALVGGWPSDKFGRKRCLIFIGVLYIVSAIWSGMSSNVYLFIVARIIGGLGVGMSTVVAPVYISEIAPPKHRGRLTGMFQFNIVFGIIVALASNRLLFGLGADAWRWMFGVAAVPSLIYTVMCFGLPESPRWLFSRGNRDAGMAVLQLIEPDAQKEQLEADADVMTTPATEKSRTGAFWTKRLRLPIMLAFLVAFFNQFSGINAILYFAPRIFELAGLGEKAALLQSVGIGIANLVFTFLGLYLIDRIGRKSLLFIGSIGYIVTLSLTAWAFFSAHYALVPWFVFAFVGAHAVGQGAVIWVYISEIFPAKQRAEGQALGCSTHWIMAALITSIFPIAATAVAPGYIFVFFAGMMVLQLIWVLTMVVETKGVPLEQVQSKLGIV
jgi:sugar porter (SP) family MFS transporter